jgi:hypothetical protein
VRGRLAVSAEREQFERLLTMVANKSECTGCGAPIWWVKTRAGKNMPLNADMIAHWATCPKAEDFRKKGGK